MRAKGHEATLGLLMEATSDERFAALVAVALEHDFDAFVGTSDKPSALRQAMHRHWRLSVAAIARHAMELANRVAMPEHRHADLAALEARDALAQRARTDLAGFAELAADFADAGLTAEEINHRCRAFKHYASDLPHCPKPGPLYASAIRSDADARLARPLHAAGFIELRPETPTDESPIGFAARAGYPSVLAELLALAAPDAANWPAWGCQRAKRALHLASNGACVRVLLRAGADPKALDGWGETPLHLVFDADSVEALLEAGAGIEAKGLAARTPLIAAATAGEPAVFAALLRRGASRLARDEQQERTAMQWARAAARESRAEDRADCAAALSAMLAACEQLDLEASLQRAQTGSAGASGGAARPRSPRRL